jgi:hypothetical protein
MNFDRIKKAFQMFGWGFEVFFAGITDKKKTFFFFISDMPKYYNDKINKYAKRIIKQATK